INIHLIQRSRIGVYDAAQVQREAVPLAQVSYSRRIERYLLLGYGPAHATQFLVTIVGIYLKELGDVIFKDFDHGHIYRFEINSLKRKYHTIGTGQDHPF